MSIADLDEFDEQPSVIAKRYQVERILGQGGMAVVYEVRDSRSGKPLALKQLRPITEDNRVGEEAIHLFEQEFYTLAQLAHPGVVEVYDFGRDDKRPYYTMQLLDGGGLRDLAPLPWKKACSLLVEVCSALSLLHSRRQLHRDVSPNNILCTRDGRARLIDFGAIVPMGPCRRVIGTPAYTSPEAVGLQILDAQSDLYSLGATLYYALTRRNAYPGKNFSELYHLWSSKPLPPSKFITDIPTDLDDLVVSLIQIDPMARPASAAEVMERLCAIAGLELDERLLVSQAYLSTPTLVGRDEQLSRLRKRLAQALEGRGNAVIIQGEAGMGRSRFLDNCVLEASLGGASVVRADASDAYGGDWSVVRTIGSQLLDTLPAVALTAAEPHLSVLSLLLPDLFSRVETARSNAFPVEARDEQPVFAPDGELDSLPPAEAFDGKLPSRRPHQSRVSSLSPSGAPFAQAMRPRIQVALRDWLLAIGTEHPLVLAIDDIHRIDEPSAACVALLSHEISQKRILIAVTADTSVPAGSKEVIALLEETGTKIKLRNLNSTHTENLLKSIFGQIAPLRVIADRIQAISGGNPRAVMQLAQHLVDNKTIRYEAGAWLIPANIDAADLPNSLADTFKARVRKLDAVALRLAQTMALSPEHSFSREECLLLTEHRQMDQLIRCLDDLVVLEIISTDAEQYWLTQGAWVPVLLDTVDAQTEHGCHLRLAEIFEKRENELFRAASHWLLAGEQERALDAFISFSETTAAMTAEDPSAYSELIKSLPDDWHFTLGTAIGLAREKGRPQREIFALQSRLNSLAAVPGTTDTQHLMDVLERLVKDSGLEHYRELGDQVEPNERLRRSLEFAQQRYDESPEFERVLEPGSAIRELSRNLVQATGVVYATFDLSLGRSLPSLEPLIHLSPALEVIDKLVRGTMLGSAGHVELSHRMNREIIERLNQPDRAGLNQTHHEFMRYGVMHSLGLMAAAMGLASSLDWASKIETSSLLHVDAQLIRMLYYLWQGNTQEAEACRQRAERLRIQNGPSRAYGGALVYAQLVVYCQADELLGVKQVLGQIEELAGKYPGWTPILQYARGEYQRIRGNFLNALEYLKQALEQTAPGEYRGWANTAGAYLKTLCALRRYDEARSKGRELLEAAEKKDLGYLCYYLGMPLALAEAQLDDFDNAVKFSEAAIDGFKTLGTTGLNLGLAYETRAYVAIRMNDYDTFRTHAELCAVEYKVGSNRALSVKHARLMERARRVSLIPVGADLERSGASTISGVMSVSELTSLLQASEGSRERAERALELLVKKSRSLGGFLYLRHEQGPVLAAENGDSACPAGMDKAAEEYLLSEIDDSREVTVTKSDDASSSSVISRWKFGQGQQYQPVLLGHLSGQDFTITGLAVLLVDPSGRFVFPAEAAAAVSSILFEAGDVSSAVWTSCTS